MNHNTNREFDKVMEHCRRVFISKSGDYGPTWRVMRPMTLTDQMLIKARRIRTLETGENLVGDGIAPEFAALVNYGIMALLQLSLSEVTAIDISGDEALKLYDREVAETRRLMQNKNHDYGEAWRDMRISSFTDIILTKLLRIKQIEDNQGCTAVSEGPEGNYRDIVIYSVFALIRLNEGADE